MIVNSDWQMTGTKDQIERQVGNGLKLTGPGWYISDEEFSLLVVISGPALVNDLLGSPWRQDWPCGTRFTFHHWHGRIAESIFAHADAPTRLDERS